MKRGEIMPVVDLFCGCGGLSKGFELAQFEIAAAFDCWQSAITCYNANFEHNAYQLDLNDVAVSVATIRQHHPTLIIGGPPCQEFSNAGKRTEGPLADLTYKYAQIITQVLPAYFVMENVPRAKDSQAFARARALYKEHNYGLTEIVLDASRCGVPQKRTRFFCIGAINARDDFLLENIFNHYIGDEITVRQYFQKNNLDLNFGAYYRHPTTYSRRAIFSVDEVAPTVRGVNRPKPANYKHHENDAIPEDQMKNIVHLSSQQRAALQTFPEDFSFNGLNLSKCDIEQMIGNAVPVELAHFVAERIQEYMNENHAAANERQEFSEWLRKEKGYTDRSISDVFSRINRAYRFLPNHKFDRYFITDLELVEEFQNLNTSIKSQIRKAINLKLSYIGE